MDNKTDSMLQEVIRTIESSSDEYSRDIYEKLDSLVESSGGRFWKAGTISYRFEDYYVRTGYVFNTESLRLYLEQIAPWGIECAPKPVYYKVWKGGACLLITRIKGFVSHCDAWSYMRHKQDVPRSAKEKFLGDVERMLERDCVNPAIVESAQNWYIIPDTGDFYIDNWTSLKPVYSTLDKWAIVKELKEMLNI